MTDTDIIKKIDAELATVGEHHLAEALAALIGPPGWEPDDNYEWADEYIRRHHREYFNAGRLRRTAAEYNAEMANRIERDTRHGHEFNREHGGRYQHRRWADLGFATGGDVYWAPTETPGPPHYRIVSGEWTDAGFVITEVAMTHANLPAPTRIPELPAAGPFANSPRVAEWSAPDGTSWIEVHDGSWLGWTPGREGTEALTTDQFYDRYPDAPRQNTPAMPTRDASERRHPRPWPNPHTWGVEPPNNTTRE